MTITPLGCKFKMLARGIKPHVTLSKRESFYCKCTAGAHSWTNDLRLTKTICARSKTTDCAKSVPAGPVQPNVSTYKRRHRITGFPRAQVRGKASKVGQHCWHSLEMTPSHRGHPDKSEIILGENTRNWTYFNRI